MKNSDFEEISSPATYVGIVALTFTLLSGCYVAMFLFQLGALVPAEYWIYEAQIIKRQLLMENRTRRKILFVGGSSAFLGIDSSRVEAALGISTINLGLHLGRPLGYMLEEITPYIGSGDIVVLPLEYQYYSSSTAYSDWFTNQVMAWDMDYFWQLTAMQKVQFVLSVRPERVWMGVIVRSLGDRLESVRRRQLKDPEQILDRARAAWSGEEYRGDKIYSFLNSDRHGDAIVRGPEPPVVADNPYGLDWDYVEGTYFWSVLQDFVLRCRAQDIAVYVAWPPIMKERIDFTAPRVSRSVKQITTRLKQMGVPMLGEPSDFQYDADLFTNRLYHLTAQGRAEHTTRLLRYLMDETRLYRRQRK
jgi:hypothetical protein